MLYAEKFADCHVHAGDNVKATYRMLDDLKSGGITDLSLLAIPLNGYDYNRVDSNLAALYYKKRYTALNIRAFGGLYYDKYHIDEPLSEQAKRILSMGCDGIKLIEMKPNCRRDLGFGINDKRYRNMFTWLEKNQIPILAHVNDPETFWDKSKMTEQEIARGWWYGDGSYPTKQAIYNEVFEVLDRCTFLKVTFAHFFFLSHEIDEAVRVMESYPNVRFDLTPGWEMYLGFSENIKEWREFFVKYADRILYGTDSNSSKPTNLDIHKLVRLGLSHDESEFPMPIWEHNIRGLDLDAETQKKICYDNYFAFAGKAPAQINADMYNAEVMKMLNLTGKTVEDPEMWLSTIKKQ